MSSWKTTGGDDLSDTASVDLSNNVVPAHEEIIPSEEHGSFEDEIKPQAVSALPSKAPAAAVLSESEKNEFLATNTVAAVADTRAKVNSAPSTAAASAVVLSKSEKSDFLGTNAVAVSDTKAKVNLAQAPAAAPSTTPAPFVFSKNLVAEKPAPRLSADDIAMSRAFLENEDAIAPVAKTAVKLNSESEQAAASDAAIKEVQKRMQILAVSEKAAAAATESYTTFLPDPNAVQETTASEAAATTTTKASIPATRSFPAALASTAAAMPMISPTPLEKFDVTRAAIRTSAPVASTLGDELGYLPRVSIPAAAAAAAVAPVSAKALRANGMFKAMGLRAPK